MEAMVFTAPGRPLERMDLPVPEPGPGQVLVKIHACGICRTDLHILDGEVQVPDPPRIPGHQVVGEVVGGEGHPPGTRVGIPWLGWTCGECRWCLSGRENLCEGALFTGRDIDGGFAEYAVADHRYSFPLPEGYGDTEVAPLLCGGLIGYRAYGMTSGSRLGLYGFGAAAHIICQVAAHEGREVAAFTSPGDSAAQGLAMELGAAWAGSNEEEAPWPLDAAIIFAPVGPLVTTALRATDRGGSVVCAGIHMSDIPSFPYADLWEEREIRSVANLTREDATSFLEVAPQVPVRTHVTTYPLPEANGALDDLRNGRLTGAGVLVPDSLC
jgi:propanol-preferring alcohol dehydrogenase